MRARRRGQSITEVVIVVALIGIAAIGVVTIYGDEVRKTFGWSSGATAGAVETEVGAYPGPKNEKKNLKNFAKVNSADCSGGVCTYH
jgi:pilus assembly protein Flp/PilA